MSWTSLLLSGVMILLSQTCHILCKYLQLSLQLEKERQMSEKEEMLKRKREEEARARRILEEDLANDGKPRVPRKSKFVSGYSLERHVRLIQDKTSIPVLSYIKY